MQIETERLILVPLTATNLRSIMRNKSQAANELGWLSDAEELSSKMYFIYQLKAENIDKDEINWMFYTYFAIVLKESNHLIGEIGFKGVPDENGEVEVGYGLDNEKWYGKGYMTEALKGLIQWAFTQESVLWVVADTDRVNVPSQKVLKKSGMLFWKEEFDYFWWKIKKN
ncbi:MAG: alanine acetyltransferase [Bacteroidetes bacterium]|nr:alanine acetyltransferase [Bacteroidota bacterium]